MSEDASVEERIAASFSGLSAQLRAAADYVVAHPFDVATRSLRTIAAQSGLAPATFSRLARALGYETYEGLRESCRQAFEREKVVFSDKLRRLQVEGAGEASETPFLLRQSAASIANIEAQANGVDQQALTAAADLLHEARRVVVLGGLSSAAVAEYLGYLVGWFSDRWTVAGRDGSSIGMALAEVSAGDVVVVITKKPFLRRTIHAAEIAANRGAALIVITDSHACPILDRSRYSFFVPTETPQFFSSHVATVVLIETIVGMLVSRAGEDARARIDEVERNNHLLDEYWMA